MDTGIGSTLREARNRRKIDLSEVEAATKIRLRFLRAMENEEWEVLPGGAYTRAFIRTYASYLGLDGERLADDFRHEDGATADGAPRVEPMAAARRGQGSRVPSWAWAVLVSGVLIAVMVAIGLAGGGGDGAKESAPSRQAQAGETERSQPIPPATAAPGVAVRLQARGEVWVCLLNGREEPLIDGQILEAGAEEGPFRSGSFTISFGNGEVTMRVDGRQAEIPVTSSPVGYEVDGDGALTELGEAERPTCT